MDTRIVAYFITAIIYCMCGVFIIPLAISLYYEDGCSIVFAACFVMTLILGILLQRHGSYDEETDYITTRDGLWIVIISWLMAAAIFGLPYLLTGNLDILSSFFEGMSGLTTTGITAMASVDNLQPSLLFWRGLTHWLGGLGIIVIFTAFLPKNAGGAFKMFTAETTGFEEDKLSARLKDTAKILFSMYLVLTAVLTVLLFFCGLEPYDAVNHAMAAISTAGFSTHDASIAFYNNFAAEAVIFVFMIFAGVNYTLYYRAIVNMDLKAIWRDEEFRWYMYIVLGACALVSLNLFLASDLGAAASLRQGFFQVASFATTTGFIFTDYEVWPDFSKLLLVLVCLIGGCAGSTAGGIKISRIVVLCRMVAEDMRIILDPDTPFTVKFNGRKLSTRVLSSISRFFFLYVISIAVLSVLLAATGVSLTEAIFGIIACISSVGPSFGILGVHGNYAHIDAWGKLILMIAMLLGRLELYTLLVLLHRDFWKTDGVFGGWIELFAGRVRSYIGSGKGEGRNQRRSLPLGSDEKL